MTSVHSRCRALQRSTLLMGTSVAFDMTSAQQHWWRSSGLLFQVLLHRANTILLRHCFSQSRMSCSMNSILVARTASANWTAPVQHHDVLVHWARCLCGALSLSVGCDQARIVPHRGTLLRCWRNGASEWTCATPVPQRKQN